MVFHRRVQAGVRADVTDGGPRSDTPLHWAASFGHVELSSMLLKEGADVNSCNNEGGPLCGVSEHPSYDTGQATHTTDVAAHRQIKKNCNNYLITETINRTEAL